MNKYICCLQEGVEVTWTTAAGHRRRGIITGGYVGSRYYNTMDKDFFVEVAGDGWYPHRMRLVDNVT